MAKHILPSSCPSCKGHLVVVKLQCGECGTEVSGEFHLCPVCRMDGDAQQLFDLFMKARGNLKQVQRELGISYPTVRLKIEDMFRKLGHHDGEQEPHDILSKVRSGELTIDEAEQLLRDN